MKTEDIFNRLKVLNRELQDIIQYSLMEDDEETPVFKISNEDLEPEYKTSTTVREIFKTIDQIFIDRDSLTPESAVFDTVTREISRLGLKPNLSKDYFSIQWQEDEFRIKIESGKIWMYQLQRDEVIDLQPMMSAVDVARVMEIVSTFQGAYEYSESLINHAYLDFLKQLERCADAYRPEWRKEDVKALLRTRQGWAQPYVGRFNLEAIHNDLVEAFYGPELKQKLAKGDIQGFVEKVYKVFAEIHATSGDLSRPAVYQSLMKQRLWDQVDVDQDVENLVRETIEKVYKKHSLISRFWSIQKELDQLQLALERSQRSASKESRAPLIIDAMDRGELDEVLELLVRSEPADKKAVQDYCLKQRMSYFEERADLFRGMLLEGQFMFTGERAPRIYEALFRRLDLVIAPELMDSVENLKNLIPPVEDIPVDYKMTEDEKKLMETTCKQLSNEIIRDHKHSVDAFIENGDDEGLGEYLGALFFAKLQQGPKS